jgi:hypothetical protein
MEVRNRAYNRCKTKILLAPWADVLSIVHSTTYSMGKYFLLALYYSILEEHPQKAYVTSPQRPIQRRQRKLPLLPTALAHLRGLRAPPHRWRVLAARSINLINSNDSMSAACRCSYDSMSASWKDQVRRRSANNVHDEPTIREEDAHATYRWRTSCTGELRSPAVPPPIRLISQSGSERGESHSLWLAIECDREK